MTVFLEKEFINSVSELYKNAVFDAAVLAEEMGLSIFLIGGIVRDLILGNEIKDVDIVVQGDAVTFCLSLEKKYACEILNIQENLRTAKVKFLNGAIIDFASTRQERYVESGVLPVAYNFGCDLKEDVKRRDFTINTLALNLVGSEKYFLIDCCGGYSDILNKKIRILHEKSFIDDPSRIVRALKFKVRFAFDFDSVTEDLMQSYLQNINQNMPLERIKGELKQYFNIPCKNLYDILIRTNVYKLISLDPVKTVNNNFFSDIKIDKNDEFFVYFVMLILNSDFDFERFNLTSNEKKIVKEVRLLIEKDISNKIDNFEIYKMFYNFSDLSLKIFYILTGNDIVIKYMNSIRGIHLFINGKDLIDLGFKPSAYFNEIFDILLREKLNNKIFTKEEEIDFIKNNIKKEE